MFAGEKGSSITANIRVSMVKYYKYGNLLKNAKHYFTK